MEANFSRSDKIGREKPCCNANVIGIILTFPSISFIYFLLVNSNLFFETASV